MAAFRTCWDPPYQSHHQRLEQPRQAPWDLPGQRRSRGVRTYDQPQPPHLRGLPSRLERPKQVRRQRFRELRPLDPGLPYGMRDPELPSSKESRLGHNSNGVVMPLLRGLTPQVSNLAKFEYLWTALDKLESRMDAYDRRLERLERLRPPVRQPSVGDSLAHCAARRYSAYDQPRRSTCWDRPQQEYQPTPPPYWPPSSPTCWESSAYVPPITHGYPPPHDAESRRLSHPSFCHDPSSTSLPPVAVIPPPPAPSCSPDVSGEEGELVHDGLPPLAPILQLYNPPNVADISEEKETLLEEKEEVDPIEEVKKVVASLDVARVISQDVIENFLGENGDLHGSDVASMLYQPTSLDADARLIPPRNNTSCLSIHECVAELSILVLNLDDHISLPLLNFYGGKEGRRSTVRYVFDPGGHASPKLLLSTLFVTSWFPP